MVRNDTTRLVTLTGSTGAGIEVFRTAAEHCVEVRLELGGKAPFIVMNDADIDKAVKAAVISRFSNCGQICTCNERMYIHEEVYDQFVEKLIAETKKIIVGDPMDENTFMGPKVNKAEIEKISQMVDLSLQQGGKILLDMTPEKKPTENGNWLYPCIVEWKIQNELIQNEVFRSCSSCYEVKDFDQALEFANDCEYGLSAYLFTNNAKYIMRAVNELEFGEVYTNRENGELINAFHNGFKLKRNRWRRRKVRIRGISAEEDSIYELQIEVL